MSDSVLFLFPVKARIASFSQNVNISWKKELTLLCTSVGIPNANIRWHLNGSVLELDGRKKVNQTVDIYYLFVRNPFFGFLY